MRFSVPRKVSYCDKKKLGIKVLNIRFGSLKKFLDKHGFICVNQQSWMAFADDQPASSEQKLLDGMLLLPNFHNLQLHDKIVLTEKRSEFWLKFRSFK